MTVEETNELTLSELQDIYGGSLAYDLGYATGRAINILATYGPYFL